MSSPPPLRALPGLLAGEAAIAELLAVDDTVVAVPEAGRAITVAALADLSSAPVLVVATPTAREADQLEHDLAAFVGAECVDVLPAWETLPFERVSPATETMGKRLRTMWHLKQHAEEGEADGRPRILVAPIRALLQRLGPRVEDAEPIVVERGAEVDPEDLVARLVHAGYRREYQVEHRGEIAVRGGIIDVFPSTADEAVRIDLWGDEVERLTVFDVADQRSTADIERAEIFGCRELLLTEEVRERAAVLAKESPFARDVFEKISEGLVFDGMESWLPWLTDRERLFTDLLGTDARVVLVEPRRFRDRATELVEEESSLAEALWSTWVTPVSDFRSETVAEGDLGLANGRNEPQSRQFRNPKSPETGAHVPGPAPDPADTDLPAPGVARLHLPFERLLARTGARLVSLVPSAENTEMTTLAARAWPPVLGDSTGLAKRLGDLARTDHRVIVCADGPGSAARIASVLSAEGLDSELVAGASAAGAPTLAPAGAPTLAPAGAPPAAAAPHAADPQALRRAGVHIVVCPLDKGALIPDSKLAILAEPDITGRHRPHRVARPRARAVEGFFDDLATGAYVVHHIHGVARYGGLVKRAIGGSERDYMLLEYRGGDRLYVPSDQIDTITPYTGGDQPTLNRLNGSEWQKQKSRVRAAVREVAKELVQLYRKRATEPGHAFSPDTPWQAELEQAFPFPETPDQLKAVADIKSDMERPVPMDRLVCGDVGFGKTEVAVRAVFKALQDGKQAAVLVPTTLLAQQHFQTFADRYAPYPVRVEMLSRFLTPAEARKVVDGLADGSIDVVVGTHRILAQEVKFKKLGILVIDEEQRFGVSHKEAIKQLSAGVDVLTLTASPIPRTLELSLTGIRDLSLINTPPVERQPILTYVGEYDDRAVAEAIRRELLREGQVFYVHNRVMDIEKVARDVSALVPDARVAVAHGQMDEGSLEQVVLDFSEGRYDVLVCTTIIESGIDMPTVNTMVVDRADMLGLGQLHQLRGRVGRSGRRAYAYLLFPPDRVVTEQAYERLKTIGEHTELGSGFKIAMRDLEIRGAGNLLGRDQSGHISAVGYDLYVRMVSEAVAEIKGEPIKVPLEITVDLPVKASLEPSYIGREDLRLEAYRRLVEVRNETEVQDIRTEWLDRYGPLPASAEGLLAVARLRAECVRAGISEVTAAAARVGAGGPGRPGEVVARISPIKLPISSQVKLRRLQPRAIWKEDAAQLIVPFKAGPDLAATLVTLVRELVPPAVTGPVESLAPTISGS